jgi:GNAT superfamily N-acetyltransferase
MKLLREYIRTLLTEAVMDPYKIVVDGFNARVTLNGEQVGVLETEKSGDELQVQWAEIQPEHQRKGLGSAMYDALEKETGMKLTHGDITASPGALHLWRKKLGETEQWMLDLYLDGLYQRTGYIQDKLGIEWDSEDFTDEQAEAIARKDLGL